MVVYEKLCTSPPSNNISFYSWSISCVTLSDPTVSQNETVDMLNKSKKLTKNTKILYSFYTIQLRINISNNINYIINMETMEMKGIIGAICGDIIGSTKEFHPIKTKDFELLPKNSKFTDDTVLTIAVASWLDKDKEHHRQTLVKEIQYYTNCFPHAGYGGRFRKWIKTKHPKPYKSWGNGSAMRVSPVAWIYDNLEETQLLARKSAVVTHNHPEGIKGAVATASAIYLARTGKNKKFIKKYVESVFNYDLSRSLDEIRVDYKFEVSCQKSVPESIICFLESDSYVDTIRNAVSLGGDADTMAAIGGSIASAYYDVPEELATECLQILDNKLLNAYLKFNDNIRI